MMFLGGRRAVAAVGRLGEQIRGKDGCKTVRKRMREKIGNRPELETLHGKVDMRLISYPPPHLRNVDRIPPHWPDSPDEEEVELLKPQPGFNPVEELNAKLEELEMTRRGTEDDIADQPRNSQLTAVLKETGMMAIRRTRKWLWALHHDSQQLVLLDIRQLREPAQPSEVIVSGICSLEAWRKWEKYGKMSAVWIGSLPSEYNVPVWAHNINDLPKDLMGMELLMQAVVKRLKAFRGTSRIAVLEREMISIMTLLGADMQEPYRHKKGRVYVVDFPKVRIIIGSFIGKDRRRVESQADEAIRDVLITKLGEVGEEEEKVTWRCMLNDCIGLDPLPQ